MVQRKRQAEGITRESEKQWIVEFHGEFLPEFRQFSEAVRREIYSLAGLLGKFGPQLGRPRVDTLKGSKFPNMKELRFRADDGVWRDCIRIRC